MMRMRTWLLSTTCLCALAVAGVAQAADFSEKAVDFAPSAGLPAVSQPNGKIAAFGGTQDGGIYGVTGSITVPLSFAYGLQLDGMVGSGKDAAFYGVGGHLFWRDPSKGLLGLYGSYVSWGLDGDPVGSPGGAEVGKIGAEGEAYLGRFSLEGLAAYQFGTYHGFAGKALLAYYPTDNFRIDGGLRYLQGPGAIGMIDVEWQPHAGSGLSLYASGSFGDGYTQVLGGLRYYFGDNGKSLIQRHREDDPGNSLPGDLYEDNACPAGQVAFENGDGIMVCGGRAG
jgi:hypothetical protein